MNSTLVPRPTKYPPPKKKKQFLLFLWFQGAISWRKKPNKFIFLVFLVALQLYFTGFLKVYVTSSFIEEILNIKNWQKCFTWVFFTILWTPDLGKKKFTTWNVLKSEVYLTCINFGKIHDDLKAWLEVIRLQVDWKMWNFVPKFNFLSSWPPEKSLFQLMVNLKFSFSESGPGSVHMPPKPIFLS